ncbi:MAG: lysine--tRNA ligase, partial [Chloroflexi bacterium]|nr:lysine--tRNA ligase [Chloroflexota bacterium]
MNPQTENPEQQPTRSGEAEETSGRGYILRDRLKKLDRIREQGGDPYPPRVTRTHSTAEALRLLEEHPQKSPPDKISICGRLLSLRIMGKASFAHLADGTGRIQLYASQNTDSLGSQEYKRFADDLDIGDFISVEGSVFYTKTEEPTLRVSSFAFLAKSLRPLPEKWHGLKDVEARFRQRYLDILSNEEVRKVFITRSRIVSSLRRFFDERGFLEVETPVLQPIYGGAAARPFTTHHQALDEDLYLRISDELYLKRLLIAGLDRVYEIGKDFRNEGLSTKNNPEFTQIEAYQAYADYQEMTRLVEEAFSFIAREILGKTKITYQGREIELASPWKRITLRQAIQEATGIDLEKVSTLEALRQEVKNRKLVVDDKPSWGLLAEEILKEYVEKDLIRPTFVIDYPLDISPLAKKKRENPKFAERFEFFIAGLECGNAFSELNDPQEQRARFQKQAQLQEEWEEAHPVDEDFIRAMEYGMPP